MLNNIVLTILTVAGVLYQYKYLAQTRKIIRLQSSKGVSKTYFLISILYEATCTIGSILIGNWILFILSVLPLVGNLVTFTFAVKYHEVSKRKSLKNRFYRGLRRLINDLEKN